MLTVGSGIAYAQYGEGFSAPQHYPPTNDTKLKLIVMNSTEFQERTTGYNYTFAGINYNWISEGNNYYDFGGARVTFFVFGFDNGTTKGEAFNLDSQMNMQNVFEYDADHPPAGYYSDTCYGCNLPVPRTESTNVNKNNSNSIIRNQTGMILYSPLKQFKSGILANDVKCDDRFTLVIKLEDGSPACVKPDTANILVERGWTSYGKENVSYDISCNTPYLRSDSNITVLYMPTNSIGKICVRYYNLNNAPTGIGMRIFEENNMTQDAQGITTWASKSTLQGNENTTVSYFIKAGSKAGFYGLSLFCGGMPFAVGYDANSTLVASDFSNLLRVIHCPAQGYEYDIEGVEGIGIRYISNPHGLPQ